MKSFLASLLAITLLSLSSCQEQDMLVPGHTKEWLHQQDGDALRFRDPSTGDTTQVHVTLREETGRITPKFGTGSYDLQKFVLDYYGPTSKALQAEAKVQLVFSGNGHIDVYPGYASSVYDYVASIEPASNSHDERIYGTNAAKAKFLDNTTLSGVSYRRIAYVELLPLNTPTGTPMTLLHELWYSKDDGLVAFSLVTGQHWYRR